MIDDWDPGLALIRKSSEEFGLPRLAEPRSAGGNRVKFYFSKLEAHDLKRPR
ncbi:MAG: hypothetical protein JWM99_1994 [Verrucomicrobiales bacterium]|nr:hypothetical protein [Verrucomicrobiales bacterium]